jgi:hypothetical protein
VALMALAVTIPMVLWLGCATCVGERLAFADGELYLMRTAWWGWRSKPIGRIDGFSGAWWLTYPDGTTRRFRGPGAVIPEASR